MQTLKQFIEDNNRWIAIFGKQGMTFPLTESDVADLARTIDSQLSPENLHCDGEISHAQAARKYQFLTTVAEELKWYARANNLRAPEFYEY